ncbi:MAG: polysaccharide deacetylase family protein, partial [Myxococcales bacterium]
QGPPSLQLWPPAPVWPSWQGGRLRVEHGQLAPGADYRLDVAWPGGATRRVAFRAASLREVVARGPEVGRVDPMAPVWARFGVDVDHASVEASFRLTPPARGRLDWPDARTVRFSPDAPLAWGDLHRVEVAGRAADGEGLPTTVWKFRPLIPPPLAVTPGEGAPAVFTFDDGTQDMSQAWRLLDLLRQHEVRAILFPTGSWARAHPDYVERALREGHRVCNHSSTHAHLDRLTDERMTAEIVGGAGHGQCDLLRPPAMATSARVERVAASLGYRMFLWHVDSRDWEGLHPQDLIHRVLGRVRPGSVLLFHMQAPGTLDALPRLFVALRTAGYRLTHEGADHELRAAGGLPADPVEAPP